jgi:hypothetical protein
MQAVCKQIDRVTRDAAEPNSNIFSFVRLRPILNGTLKFNYIQCRRIGQTDAPGPSLSEHDLRANASRLSRGKPVSTFPDHALNPKL